MMEAFVIAFISCTGQACTIAYPRPNQTYPSYNECKAQLPQASEARAFDAANFVGAEIACIQVPNPPPSKGWILVEPTNLRNAPSANADVITTVKRGTVLQVVDRQQKWLKVLLEDGRSGFVWSDRAEEVQPDARTPRSLETAPARVSSIEPAHTDSH